MLAYIYKFIHVYYLFSNYEYLPLQMMPRLLQLQHPHSFYIETHSHGYHWIWPCTAEGNTCEEKKWFLNKPVKLYMSKNVYTMTEKY